MIKPREELAAEARLTAFAPELLEVAKMVLESQKWDGNDPAEDRWTKLYFKAKRAITLAEGREP